MRRFRPTQRSGRGRCGPPGSSACSGGRPAVPALLNQLVLVLDMPAMLSQLFSPLGVVLLLVLACGLSVPGGACVFGLILLPHSVLHPLTENSADGALLSQLLLVLRRASSAPPDAKCFFSTSL